MKQITSETITPSIFKHSMHKDSHTITKMKPKIRIIHIIAPEIIKTDVENFRELVQRLTGKNAAQVKGKNTKKEQRKNIESSPQDHHHQHQHHQHMNMLQDTNYRMKEEESDGISYGSVENSSNGFLSGFGMEGFIQDLSEFPMFPFKLPTQINMFGEVPLC